jgi:hypothetical protein
LGSSSNRHLAKNEGSKYEIVAREHARIQKTAGERGDSKGVSRLDGIYEELEESFS